MTYAVAWAALTAGFAFALWPVVRHRAPAAAVEEAPPRPSAQLDEIDLDRASGRLSDQEAAERRAGMLSGGDGP